MGCWIGMTDRPAAGTQAAEGNWRWSDGSAVNFLAFSPGEPNNYRVGGSASQYQSGIGEGPGAGLGEDVVSITFAATQFPGGWNDEHGKHVRQLHCWKPIALCQAERPLRARVRIGQSWTRNGNWSFHRRMLGLQFEGSWVLHGLRVVGAIGDDNWRSAFA